MIIYPKSGDHAEIRCRVSIVRFEANEHQEDVKCKL